MRCRRLTAIAAIIAADFPSTISAQSDETETAGRIVARRLVEGRTEFGWQPTGGAVVRGFGGRAERFPLGGGNDGVQEGGGVTEWRERWVWRVG